MEINSIKTKIKIWFFTFFFLVFQIGSPFLYASNTTQKCWTSAPICLQTPETLNLYLEFQTKAIALLATDPFETTTEQITAWEWGLLTNKVLNIITWTGTSTSPLGVDILKELEIAASNLLIWTMTSSALFILSALNVEADGLMSILILFQERPIVRDRAKLLDIDRGISQTTYILGQKGKTWKTIKNSAKLQMLVSEYQKLKLLSPDSSFEDQVSYLSVLMTLQEINTSVKTFLSSNSTYNLETLDGPLKFEQKRIKDLKNAYHCARWTFWFSCSDDVKSFTTNLKTLLSNTKNTGNSAAHKIKTALSKLKNALQWFKNFRSTKNKSLTPEEIELLRSVYWLDTTNLTDEQLSSRSPVNISSRSKALWQEAKKWVSNFSSTVWDDWKDFAKQFKKTETTTTKKETEKKTKAQKEAEETARQQAKEKAQKKEASALKNLSEQTSSLILNHKNAMLHQKLSVTLKTLLTAQYQIKVETELNNTLLATNQFSILSHQIQQLATEVWNKQSWTRKYLNDICSYQCSNKPSSTCYIQ